MFYPATMKILLLGAGGFMGVNLTERLLADGFHDMTALSIHDEKIAHLINHPALNCLHLNIGQPDNALKIMGVAIKRCEISDERFRIEEDPPRPEFICASGEELYVEGYQDCDHRSPNIDRARKLLERDQQSYLVAVITKTMGYFFNEHRKKQGGLRQPQIRK